jgi:UDP-3-O-[3-hydroxymyristoyl] N-acetylglucosamine deacetylase
MMDMLGDISLVGHPIMGHLYAERAGHAIHTALADRILRRRDCYTLRTAEEIESNLANAV